MRATIAAFALAACAAAAAAQESGTLVIPGDDPSLDWLFPEGDPLPLGEAATLDPDPFAEGTPGGLSVLGTDPPPPAPRAELVASSTGAMLRGLDRVSGAVTEIPLSLGKTATLGRLQVTMHDCRYPVDNPPSNAYARLTVVDAGAASHTRLFDGWMIAASPALSALDHPRYDVWVIRCDLPATAADGEVEAAAEGG